MNLLLSEELRQALVRCLFTATHNIPFSTVNELIQTLEKLPSAEAEGPPLSSQPEMDNTQFPDPVITGE